MARNYNVWLMNRSGGLFLDSGTQMIHDGRGHDLYRYQNGILTPLSGNDTMTLKADGRILDKTGNQAGFIMDYSKFTEEIRASKKPAAPAAASGLVAAKPPVPSRTERDWQSMMKLPSAGEIISCNRTAALRSPYLAAWLATDGRPFTGYSVDFRAEYQPDATYCCLANFDLDYSALTKTYASVSTEYSGVAGYAGLQRLPDGKLKAILSFWDVYCKDRSGNRKTIRARLVVPAWTNNDSFGGEGTGAHCLTDYYWRPGAWYRMLLICGKSETTGNTTIEQWIQDLASTSRTKLCVYDLGVPDVRFRGRTAVFLENFDPRAAGEIRTMECRNFLVYRNGWQSVKKGTVESSAGSYKGSYAFAAAGDTLCMITTGVEGKGSNQGVQAFKLK